MKARYRVWQWGIETGLGSHGQSKMSSTIIKTGFDSEAIARAWAASQDTSSWGTWSPIQCGENVVVECEFANLPRGYRKACQLANA